MSDISLYAAGQGPDFSGLTDLIMTWVNPILTLAFVIVAIVATVALIVLGVKILREKDPAARQENIKHLGYWFLGLLITGISALVVNVIFPIIFDSVSLDIGS
ncbi:MAG: pilin [Ureaplasma sp.]|nr:pilin [Ureaplasma sp.]